MSTDNLALMASIPIPISSFLLVLFRTGRYSGHAGVCPVRGGDNRVGDPRGDLYPSPLVVVVVVRGRTTEDSLTD